MEVPRIIFLQYVNDLLLAFETKIDRKRTTGGLRQQLQTLGYIMPNMKTQPWIAEATYLCYWLRGGK